MPRRRGEMNRALRRGDRAAWWTLAVVLPVWIVAPALFPRFLWRRRIGWRGQLAVAVVQTAWGTLGRHVLLPKVRAFEERNRARRDEVRRDLAAELGREPTQEELERRHLERLEAVMAAAEDENRDHTGFRLTFDGQD